MTHLQICQGTEKLSMQNLSDSVVFVSITLFFFLVVNKSEIILKKEINI